MTNCPPHGPHCWSKVSGPSSLVDSFTVLAVVGALGDREVEDVRSGATRDLRIVPLALGEYLDA
jgi:hypothetical protein